MPEEEEDWREMEMGGIGDKWREREWVSEMESYSGDEIARDRD